MFENQAQNSMAQYAGLGTASNMQNMGQIAQRTTEMDQAVNKLAAIAATAAAHCDRLQCLSDRLVGSDMAKPGAPGQSPQPVPNGHLAKLDMVSSELMLRLERADAIVNRLIEAI